MVDLELTYIPLLQPEIKWIIEALELRSTLYKAGSIYYELNKDLKEKFIKRIKEEQ